MSERFAGGRAVSSRPSMNSVQTSIANTQADQHERVLMFGEFAALTPCYGDPKAKIAAMVKATRELPVELLRMGLARLQRQTSGGKEFVLADVRRECALALRERHRAEQGLDPTAGLGGK